MNPEVTQALAKEVDYILSNEHSFLMELFKVNPNFHDLKDVSFSPDNVKAYYWNTDTGQHFADSAKLQDYLAWGHKEVTI
jgi:hypothetical protein